MDSRAGSNSRLAIPALVALALVLGALFMLQSRQGAHVAQVAATAPAPQAAATSAAGPVVEPRPASPVERTPNPVAAHEAARSELVAAGPAAAAPAAEAAPAAARAAQGHQAADSNSIDAGRQPAALQHPPGPFLQVRVTRDLPVHARPGAGPQVGSLPARSPYLGAPITAWVLEATADGRYGRVTVPWTGTARTGWVEIAGLPRSTTSTMVRASLSERRLQVIRAGKVVLDVPAGIGAPSSSSPRGRFFVTDPVAVPASQPQFGSYAFGLSTTQPNLPAGWTGGDQMAIHGTNDPGSIGGAASAGCLRVSEQALAQLRTLLEPGTPVVIGR